MRLVADSESHVAYSVQVRAQCFRAQYRKEQ